MMSTCNDIKRKNILLIIDVVGWAFDNISKNIIAHSNNKYIIHVIPQLQLYNDICNENISTHKSNNYDTILFFWYGDVSKYIHDFFKNELKVNNIFFAIFDYSLWVNNSDKKYERLHFESVSYFMKNCEICMYASQQIKKYIVTNFPTINENMLRSCYDGVDAQTFINYGYTGDIYTKNKLAIGWLGNSNPRMHGINKGFIIIKKVVDGMNDMFEFRPQDSMTNKISHNEVPNYIKDIDIIVCFSIAEGTPNQILEASSSGKCWISTNVGIVQDLNNTIENNPTGIIIDRTEEQLTNTLIYLYKNRDILVRYGSNGRRAIEKMWDWKFRVKQYYDIFDL